MIELTLEQVRAIALANGQPSQRPKLIDPTTKTTYALVPTEDKEPPLETPDPRPATS